MGRYVTVYEAEDGEVSIRHDGRELPARAFHKEGHVHQAAIVENKLLSAALQHAKRLQEERDEKKLKSWSLNKREKRLLRARQAAAAAPPRPPSEHPPTGHFYLAPAQDIATCG